MQLELEMFKNKKMFIGAVLTLLVAAFAFGQSTDSATRLMLQKADDAYVNGDTKTAFVAVNNALRINESTYLQNGIPTNVIIVARPIYRQMLKDVEAGKDYNMLEEVKARVEKFSDLADDDIKRQITRIEKTREEEARAAELEANRKSNERFAQTIADETRKTNEKVIESISEESRRNNETIAKTLSEGLEKQNVTMTNTLKEQNEMQMKSNHTVLIAILIVCGILVIVFIIVIINIVTSARANARQQEQFEATLKLVAGMQQTNNQLLLGSVTEMYGDSNLKSAGSSRWGVNALPEPEMSVEEQEELKNLAVKCEDLGSQIDQISNRKNNSKNVSELVFKMSMKLGLNQNTSKIYFCAAMVYDIGFLTLPEELLQAESFTEEQRQQMRDHLTGAADQYDFVPERYRQIFDDACRHHHENMDGTGYPDGLAGEAIPQIARLINVAESYNALVSRRNYKQIYDKESAIEEMKSKPGLYDPEVVAVLDGMV